MNKMKQIDTLKIFQDSEIFAQWSEEHDAAFSLTTEASAIILRFSEINQFSVCLDENNDLQCLHWKKPELTRVPCTLEDLLSVVSHWIIDYIKSEEITTEDRAEAVRNMAVINRLIDENSCHDGYPIGQPTVADLIDLLSKFPANYQVDFCRTDGYLYLFASEQCVTFDSECYL